MRVKVHRIRHPMNWDDTAPTQESRSGDLSLVVEPGSQFQPAHGSVEELSLIGWVAGRVWAADSSLHRFTTGSYDFTTNHCKTSCAKYDAPEQANMIATPGSSQKTQAGQRRLGFSADR
jgi:hypothetical protein